MKRQLAEAVEDKDRSLDDFIRLQVTASAHPAREHSISNDNMANISQYIERTHPMCSHFTVASIRLEAFTAIRATAITNPVALVLLSSNLKPVSSMKSNSDVWH